MRLFTTYSHTSTLRGHEASGKTLQQQKTSNEERKTEKKGAQHSSVSLEADSEVFPHHIVDPRECGFDHVAHLAACVSEPSI